MSSKPENMTLSAFRIQSVLEKKKFIDKADMKRKLYMLSKWDRYREGKADMRKEQYDIEEHLLQLNIETITDQEFAE